MKKDFNEKVVPLVKNFRGLIRRELSKSGRSGKEWWGSVTPSEEIVEDLLQEVLAEAWRKWPPKLRYSLSTWVGWIVRGRVLNYKKYKSRHPEELPESGTHSQLGTPELELVADQSAASLDDEEREFVDLRLDGKTNQEIADITGYTLDQVKKRFSKIKSKMHDSRGNQ